jgi:hypothetical protein
MKKICFLLFGLIITVLAFVEIPQTDISNGIIKAKLYLPDAKNGYYRGSRFDWSGNMPGLEFKGHSYFGKWFTKYSPEIHDVIMGPVEDFTSLDYPETKPGESFIKIGVGVLDKPDDKAYDLSRTYPIKDGGTWKVKKQSDKVLFTHELSGLGYSYKYEKTVQLVKDKPEMVLTHTLRNTGKKTIETTVYCHNFFLIDKQLAGPSCVITFPFSLKGEGKGFGELVKFDGNQIVFLKELASNQQVYCGDVQGYGSASSDYDIRIENKNTGAGVRITCDQPIVRLVFWSCSTTACPEPYIKIKVDPGKEFTWKINYEFYTFSK